MRHYGQVSPTISVERQICLHLPPLLATPRLLGCRYVIALKTLTAEFAPFSLPPRCQISSLEAFWHVAAHATNCLYFWALVPEHRPSTFFPPTLGNNSSSHVRPPPSSAHLHPRNLWRRISPLCQSVAPWTVISHIYVIARVLLNLGQRLLVYLADPALDLHQESSP
jgi:hypothetical protein